MATDYGLWTTDKKEILMICRHCQEARVSRPRGLCWRCFYTPGLRDIYPLASKLGQGGRADFYGRAPPPAFPTQALPGTPEKIALLGERARLQQSLWHPDDATFADQMPALQQAG
jgi:hypothetical protein